MQYQEQDGEKDVLCFRHTEFEIPADSQTEIVIYRVYFYNSDVCNRTYVLTEVQKSLKKKSCEKVEISICLVEQ